MNDTHTLPDGRTWVHAGEVDYVRKRDGQAIKRQVWHSWCAVCFAQIEATTPTRDLTNTNALFKLHCDDHKSASPFTKRGGKGQR